MNIEKEIEEIDLVENAAERIDAIFELMVRYTGWARTNEPVFLVPGNWKVIMDYFIEQTA